MSVEQDNEELKTMGSGLKTARESKGLSLKDVNEQTRISVTILDAIENGKFHLLPPGVYARNFIRTYADFLGVDSQKILEHFKKETERAAAPPVLQKEDAAVSPADGRRHWKVIAVGVAVLILVGVLIWTLNSCWSTGKSGNRSSAEKKTLGGAISREILPVRGNGVVRVVRNEKAPFIPAPAAPSGEAPMALPPQASGMANPQTSSSQEVYPPNPRPFSAPVKKTEGTAGPYELSIEAKERTWLQIRADDGKPFQAVMRAGERVNRSARERLTLDIGNAAGVIVTFQGKRLDNLGKQGQVVHLSLP